MLRGALRPDDDEVAIGALDEVVENCGAGRTSANPVFATWWFRWLRLLTEPRGIPSPADPAFTTCREAKVETGPAFPTTTVFTVPAAGATRGWKLVGNAPV